MEQKIWRKSSYSGGNGGNCLEVADTAAGTLFRDTQNRRLGHLEAPAQEWNALLLLLKNSPR
jgi:hypothetical protein